MDSNTEKRIRIYDPVKKEQTVYKYLDALLAEAPESIPFKLSLLMFNLPKDLQKEMKEESHLNIYDVEMAFTGLGYAEKSSQEDLVIKLTDKGREAKKRGGHSKYEAYKEAEENAIQRLRTLEIQRHKRDLVMFIIGLISGLIPFLWSVLFGKE